MHLLAILLPGAQAACGAIRCYPKFGGVLTTRDHKHILVGCVRWFTFLTALINCVVVGIAYHRDI